MGGGRGLAPHRRPFRSVAPCLAPRAGRDGDDCESRGRPGVMSRAGFWTTDPAHAYRAVADALRSAGPALLFGLRFWTAVCLALYIAFWLQLDNPYWAGTSAALVCQPRLGASLRK